jgi:hypothetical protein
MGKKAGADKKWIAVDVDDDIHAALTEKARENDLFLSQFVRQLLKREARSYDFSTGAAHRGDREND